MTVSELRDVAREALAGLWTHRVRSFLSALGILFGVAAVIGILSIGEGARREQESLISQLGILNFQLQNRDLSDDPEQAQEIRRVSAGLSERDRLALAEALPGALHVGAMRELPVMEMNPRPKDAAKVRVVGASPEWLSGSNLQLRQGRPLTMDDEEHISQVCLLGALAKRELFGAEPALGRWLRVDQTWLRVVGIFGDSTDGSRMEGTDLTNRAGSVVVPLNTVLRRLVKDDGKPPYSEIQITVGDPSQVEGHAALARRVVDRLHHEQPDYELVVPLRLLEQSRAQQRIFNLVMGLIAGISLVVGGIGIMNIMLASVLERTREIGIRLAIGARPRDIRALFLVEAGLISVAGGVLGVIVGIGISWVVAAFTGWATAVSIQAVLLATLISAAEGVVFGFVPARMASLLPPAIAVRQS